MRYIGNTNYNHQQQAIIGVLVVNLGTPTSPTSKGLRNYLAEFLWDPRVVELPRWLWWPLLHGIILRFRPRYSAKLYQRIWTEAGSPLLVTSQKQVKALQSALNTLFPNESIKVILGMRYGNPSIAAGLEQLRKFNLKKLVILPLYPQYSATTTGSTIDAVAKVLQRWRWLPELHIINNYADYPNYINALADSIRNHWRLHQPGEKLLFSFHGIPQRNVSAGDPYYCYCLKTSRLVAEKLQLSAERWSLVFQSRFGRQQWLQPYCDEVLLQLAQQGIKTVDVICPGFAADCLETLEEICIRNQEIFVTAGGTKLNYISALNDSPQHIDALAKLVAAQLYQEALETHSFCNPDSE